MSSPSVSRRIAPPPPVASNRRTPNCSCSTRTIVCNSKSRTRAGAARPGRPDRRDRRRVAPLGVAARSGPVRRNGRPHQPAALPELQLPRGQAGRGGDFARPVGPLQPQRTDSAHALRLRAARADGIERDARRVERLERPVPFGGERGRRARAGERARRRPLGDRRARHPAAPRAPTRARRCHSSQCFETFGRFTARCPPLLSSPNRLAGVLARRARNPHPVLLDGDDVIARAVHSWPRSSPWRRSDSGHCRLADDIRGLRERCDE